MFNTDLFVSPTELRSVSLGLMLAVASCSGSVGQSIGLVKALSKMSELLPPDALPMLGDLLAIETDIDLSVVNPKVSGLATDFFVRFKY